MEWSKELKPGFPIVLDPTGATEKTFQHQTSLPYNIVIDGRGKVVGINTGDIDELKKLVGKAVSAAPAAPRQRAGR